MRAAHTLSDVYKRQASAQHTRHCSEIYLLGVVSRCDNDITFRVSNDLWDVFTKFAKGYREFELNKALALSIYLNISKLSLYSFS